MEGDTSLPAAVRNNAEMIRRNVEIETRLIDDLLDLSTVRSGKMRVLKQPTNVHRLIGHATETIKTELAAKSVALRQTLEAPEHFVSADPARLQQALWNLLKNAAKFTPDGGSVFIRTRTEGARLLIEIADTGRGIEPAVQAHIFEPFEQGGAEVTARYGGLGLGLAVVKGILGLHQGEITVASKGADTGATFTVWLPLCEPASALGAGEPEGFAEGAGEGVRVLVVEDRWIRRACSSGCCGWTGCTWNRQTAWRRRSRWRRRMFSNVVVSDLGLPDGSGNDLMRLLEQRESRDRHERVWNG